MSKHRIKLDRKSSAWVRKEAAEAGVSITRYANDLIKDVLDEMDFQEAIEEEKAKEEPSES